MPVLLVHAWVHARVRLSAPVMVILYSCTVSAWLPLPCVARSSEVLLSKRALIFLLRDELDVVPLPCCGASAPFSGPLRSVPA